MKDILVSSYDYLLPDELIAKYPVTPRDMAKLLIYDRKTDKNHKKCRWSIYGQKR
jgi:S-adenosylmethionine:tRNA ribosyltransferase-isomerase